MLFACSFGFCNSAKHYNSIQKYLLLLNDNLKHALHKDLYTTCSKVSALHKCRLCSV